MSEEAVSESRKAFARGISKVMNEARKVVADNIADLYDVPELQAALKDNQKGKLYGMLADAVCRAWAKDDLQAQALSHLQLAIEAKDRKACDKAIAALFEKLDV